jgi:RNA polymerase sigma factor (sigma-70 family)
MRGDVRFPTTQWSLVSAAGRATSTASREALADLCARYWLPVFAFVRRLGHSPEDAQDLTQGFFARLIEKGDLGDATASRGRFRSFLLAGCRHYVSNEHDRARAQKRGGGQIAIDIADAEARYERTLTDADTPESLYQRQWALTLLASVLDDLRARYVATGQGAQFDRLRDFVTGDDDAGLQSAAAEELGMSAGAVKVAIHRLRRRYRDLLRSRVAETVESNRDIDDEIRILIGAL